jgi:uncharacterized protein
VCENIVYDHLKSNGYVIFTGNWDDKEVGFFAIKNEEKAYFQVTYLLIEEETLNREFGNLLLIIDNFPKYVISYEPIPQANS